jgi:hypothetical protein
MRSGGWQSSVRLRFWLLAPFAWAASARAATVTWSAPPECDDPRQTTEEAERLLGRSLAEIQAVDFEVNVARAGERDWSATLVTISQPSHERRERVLRGTSCNEVTAAAGVALAMVVDASEQKPHTEEAPAAEPVNHPEETPPVVGPPPAATQRARAIPPLAPPPRLGAAFSVGLVGDVGSLPAVAPGGEGAASLRYGSWQLTALGNFYFPTEKHVLGEKGAELKLSLGGLLGCRRWSLGVGQALACLGAEAGWLSGTGLGLQSPRTEGAFWWAPRADAGAAVPIGGKLSFYARLGLVLPQIRREFVVEDALMVHRAAPISGRAGVGIELSVE